MLRGLEPEDRIRELGDASVPFRFAKYALILTAVSRSWSGRWGRLLGKPTVPGGLAQQFRGVLMGMRYRKSINLGGGVKLTSIRKVLGCQRGPSTCGTR